MSIPKNKWYKGMPSPNPKGNPNIGEIAKRSKTGPKTELGKLKCLIMSGAVSSGKRCKNRRKCNKCPLKPLIIKDREIMQCPHYEKNKSCKLTVGEWKYKLKAYFIAEDLGEGEILKLAARDAYSYSLMNADVESIKKGAPGFMTNEFLKTTVGAAEGAGKLKLDAQRLFKDTDKQQNVQVLDMTKLIEAYQEKQHTVNVSPSEEDKPEDDSSDEDVTENPQSCQN